MLWAFQSARVRLKTLQKISPCSRVHIRAENSYTQCQVFHQFVCRTVTRLRPSNVVVVFSRNVSFRSLRLEGDGQAIKLAPCCRRRAERELSGFGVIPAVGHGDLKPMRRRKLMKEISRLCGNIGRGISFQSVNFNSITVVAFHKTPWQLFGVDAVVGRR